MHKRRTTVFVEAGESLAEAFKLGKRLVLAPGLYEVGSNLVIPDGASIHGRSPESTHVKGRITFGSGQYFYGVKLGDKGYAIRHNPLAVGTQFVGCRLRGGGGSGGDANNVLLGNYSSSVRAVRFKDCEIECTLGDYDNVRVTENATDPKGAHVEDIVFEGCHFGVSNGVRSGCPRMDFEAYCDAQSGGTTYYHGWERIDFLGCVFEPSDWYNIDLTSPEAYRTKADGYHGSCDSVIRGCTFKGGTLYTICVESPAGVVIEDNLIHRAGGSTFKMGCGDMSTVETGTVVRGNSFLLDDGQYGKALGSPAFYLKGGGNTVTDNTIVGATVARTLFWLEQARRNTVTGNLISVGSGAKVIGQDSASSGNTLSPNTVNGAEQ